MGAIGNLFNHIFTYPIFNALVVLYHLFGDFALSIIVLTLIIKLILFPLTLQQLKSMKATQALQPQMAEIRKKYAKDQQAQAQAMQQLYKEYNVNPLSGCLPLLIQLPVLYGLFYALSAVFRNATLQSINAIIYPFIPHFSTFPNIYLDWFTFISPSLRISLGAADPTHILPILAGLATFVQLRMSQPKTAAAAPANDPSTQSMKTMQYIMPLVTVFIGWSFPAGLALYWTVSSVFQAIQQYFVTGWGSLLVTPNFGGKDPASGTSSKSAPSTTSSSNGKRRETPRVVEGSISQEDGDTSDGEGPIGSQMHTVPHANTNGSTARHRSSNNSASARRRSSNNKRRAYRS